MNREFNASKGFLIYAIYIFSSLFFLFILLNFFFQKKMNFNILLFVLIFIILLYFISSIRYVISSRYLTIKIGILSIKFDLKNLEKIYYKKLPIFKDEIFKLSINFYTDFKKIIVLQFKRFSVTISPENPEVFVEVLKAYKPDLKIE